METVGMRKKYIMISLVLTIILVLGKGFNPSLAYWAYVDKESQEKDCLLRGFNVFAGNEISSDNAFTNSYIIDKDNKEYLAHLGKRTTSDMVTSFYSNKNLFSVEKDYSRNVGMDLFGQIYTIDSGLHNQFNTSSNLKNIIDTKYELYTIEIHDHFYISDFDIVDIKNCLDSDFKRDLYAVDSFSKAEALFKKYGTHLLTGATYGGRINIANYMATNSSQTNLNENQSLETKIQNSIRSASIGYEYDFEENTDTCTSNYSFTVFGGKMVSALSIDSLFLNANSYSFAEEVSRPYDMWVKSIQEDENVVIVSIPNGAKAVPIWELLDEKYENAYDVRDLLVESYLKLCNKKYYEYLGELGQTDDLNAITEIKTDLKQSSIEFLDKKFEVGEIINLKDLSGLAVRITYSDGTNKLIKNIDEAEELELIDTIVGKNGDVFLSAKDYGSYEILKLNIVDKDKESLSPVPTESVELIGDEDEKQEDKDNITSIEQEEEPKPSTTITEDSKNGANDEKNNNMTVVWILLAIIICLVVTVIVLLKKGDFKRKEK